ncbi:hypothetical protein UA08_02065 [Talaromyces atroroseus]|uniref:F-box domain-containing protein n=1 Tax=Talaromyces atroroseus TaxID=1441469 RepID=A0A1Q5QAK2_TALAT|nr:hypothetical protein UA08_02065 [Talaromyces atroroseus]OKL62977.1 hypothetical protein UA08_02065 [Talaromyces atroroseus]
MPNESSGSRLKNWLKPKKSRQTLRKRGGPPASLTSASSTTLAASIQTGRYSYEKFYENSIPDVPAIPSNLAPLQAHREKYKHLNARLDTQLGENLDYTTILHSLSLQEHYDSDEAWQKENLNRPPGEPAIASLAAELWIYIASFLDPKSTACLALASKTLYARLAAHHPLAALNMPENYEYKLDFLAMLDRFFPYHLLCIPCAQYHRRTQIGHEKLQPTSKLNPLFRCPNERNNLNPPPRHRIAQGRTLPFTFVQLATRARRFEVPFYGVTTESLARRWKKDDWTLSTRYHIHEGRLLMRVVSQCFATPGLTPSGKRLLLYSREDYWPFFSACPHWRDGELMNVCKCALDHLPVPRNTAGLQGIEHKFRDRIHGRIYDPHARPSQCANCQPLRRCPRCPTEYLVEVKLAEDQSNNPNANLLNNTLTPNSISTIHNESLKKRQAALNSKFRHAIVVTRWSDLGDGKNPFPPQTATSSLEWAACNGGTENYDSFKHLGRRGISGIFESAFTHDTIPGRRIVSMNPEMKTGGEERDDWY